MAAAIRNIGRPGIAGCAISAVDVALWDLKARLLELPLTALLGRVHEQVPVYGSGGFTTYDQRQLCDQLTGWVHDQRIPRVKIKIGESWGGPRRAGPAAYRAGARDDRFAGRAVRRRQRRLRPQAGHPGCGRGA